MTNETTDNAVTLRASFSTSGGPAVSAAIMLTTAIRIVRLFDADDAPLSGSDYDAVAFEVARDVTRLCGARLVRTDVEPVCGMRPGEVAEHLAREAFAQLCAMAAECGYIADALPHLIAAKLLELGAWSHGDGPVN